MYARCRPGIVVPATGRGLGSRVGGEGKRHAITGVSVDRCHHRRAGCGAAAGRPSGDHEQRRFRGRSPAPVAGPGERGPVARGVSRSMQVRALHSVQCLKRRAGGLQRFFHHLVGMCGREKSRFVSGRREVDAVFEHGVKEELEAFRIAGRSLRVAVDP